MGAAGSDLAAPQWVGGGPPRFGERPFFFLASCPDGALHEAVDVATRYGGFHCGPVDPSSPKSGAMATAVLLGTQSADAQSLGAWRGRVEAQFATLMRMSPRGRKVVGVAIAGSGVCNDQREFLQQLHMKKEFERFELKVCGDVPDMERWLRSEGYVPDRLAELERNAQCSTASIRSALSFAFDPRQRGGGGVFAAQASQQGPHAMHGRAGGYTLGAEQSQTGFLGSFFTSAARNDEAARRERVLGDVFAVMEELRELTEASEAQVLREAEERLEEFLAGAREAGLTPDELFEGEAMQIELKEWADAAETRAKRSWCCCCGAKKKKKSQGGQAAADSSLLQSRAGGDEVDGSPGASVLQHRIRALEQEVMEQQVRLEQGRSKLRLPDGTKCLYLSQSLAGWIPAVVTGYDASGMAYDLDVRKHAALENIMPLPEVPAAESWPIGTPVSYTSDSMGGRELPAVVRGFHPGVRGGPGTYDLDVKPRADCTQIRPRAP